LFIGGTSQVESYNMLIKTKEGRNLNKIPLSKKIEIFLKDVEIRNTKLCK
jgi:hypothetical protein